MTKRRVRYRLSRSGVVFLGVSAFILLASFIQQVNLMVLIGALLVATCLVGAWIAGRRIKSIGVARRLPVEAFVGIPFPIGYEASAANAPFRALSVDVEDVLVVDGDQARLVAALALARDGEFLRGECRLVVNRRGRQRIGPATASTRFPFGFIECRVEFPTVDDFIIFPRLGMLNQAWQRMIGAVQASAGRQSRRTPQPEEFHSIREYEPGDNPRHVHWRTTARRGELMVKTFESSQAADFLLAFEAWASADPSAEESALFEHAVSFMATVAVDLCQKAGVRVAIIVAGAAPVVLRGTSSPRLRLETLNLFAELKGSSAADIAASIAVQNRLAVGARQILVVTTRPESSRSDLDRQVRLRGEMTYLNARAGDLDRYFSFE